MPVLSRVYGLTPSDVWALTRDEWNAYVNDLEGSSNG